ncbi:DinB family protein [Flavobacterium hydrophilum]|uniref:Damage-inducible protein DinB n=1 Tax=Flavobacterium hydrophilum TaxID=2211445 RepID=A0A2V4C439_9FLAO|nr:DinB family protein [Flavobacterium hydrophilum]PXY44873.1 damage-inducible protein DinB [Flavobacterium hydrophilum]
MSLKRIMSNYADYNLWVNQQFVNWLSSKSDELLYAEVPSSFSTIIKTLDHIWSTEEYWFYVISEADLSEKKPESELSKEEIFEGLLNSSVKLKHLINSLSEEDLIKEVKIVNPWFECELPISDYLLQVINHGTYHRGQIVTMGRNLGITDASNTDYNFYNVVKQQH